MLSPMSESSVAEDWWLKATQRWGLILIGSHGGDAVLNAWKVKGEEAKTILATRLANRGARRASTLVVENERLIHLLQSLDELQDSQRGAISSCPESTGQSREDAYILLEAFRLDETTENPN